MKRLLLGVTPLLAAALALTAQTREIPRASNVILITLDGVRVQEMFGGLDLDVLRSTVKKGPAEDTATYERFWAPTPEARRERLMPFLWGTLLKQHGSIVGNPAGGAVMRMTNRHRFSYPGYAEILTGQAHDDVINSNDARRNPYTTVLEFVRKRLGIDATKVAAFASWQTFDAIVEHDPGTIFSNAGIEPYPSSDPLVLAVNQLQQETLPPWENVRHDSFTFRMAMTHLAAQHPRLLYLALDEPDDWAHDGRYDHVLLSLARIDGYLQQLWRFVESRDEYRGKTTIILSVDHGRGRTPQDWRNHGKDVEGAQDIWMAVVSPSSRLRGEWPAGEPVFQNQIAATVAAQFGLDFAEAVPGAGKPMLRITQ